MATFEKRSGHWRVTVRMRGMRQSATFTTKAAAQAWAAEQETEIRNVAHGAMPTRTLRQAFDRYKFEKSSKKRGVRWETIRIDAFARQMADFVDRPLAGIQSDALVAWQDARLSHVSAGTVLRERNLLSAIFSACVEWRWIEKNPLKTVKRPTTPPARTRRISDDEIRRICLALGLNDETTVSTHSHQVAIALRFAVETAMRQGEILGLEWSRINGRVAHLPKTKTGVARDVPLSTEAMRLLDRLRGIDPARCFTVPSSSADTLFRRARDAAGVEGLRFHDSRREGTSRLSKKVDVLTLARITGHEDINMLLVYYQTDMATVAEQIG